MCRQLQLVRSASSANSPPAGLLQSASTRVHHACAPSRIAPSARAASGLIQLMRSARSICGTARSWRAAGSQASPRIDPRHTRACAARRGRACPSANRDAVHELLEVADGRCALAGGKAYGERRAGSKPTATRSRRARARRRAARARAASLHCRCRRTLRRGANLCAAKSQLEHHRQQRPAARTYPWQVLRRRARAGAPACLTARPISAQAGGGRDSFAWPTRSRACDGGCLRAIPGCLPCAVR